MNIRVREFSKDGLGDYEMISRWYAEWEKECPSLDLLPGLGFIVEECVAGFLYTTDSKVCFIDCFISDPNVTKSERDSALNTLVTVLLDEAKGLDNRLVVANTVNGNIGARALKHGFNFVGDHGVFSKELK